MHDRDTELVLSVAAHPSDRYGGLDLNRLAVFALGHLRSLGVAPSFENMTATLYRMFPDRFGLAGYPYPDSNRVNRALLQLGPKYRNWARGSTRTGYALTTAGEAILDETRRLLQPGGGNQPPMPSRANRYTWDVRSDIDEIRNTPAFRRFVDGGAGAVVDDDVWDALNAFPYTPQRAVRQRLIDLRRYAREAEDELAEAFVDELRRRFELVVKS